MRKIIGAGAILAFFMSVPLAASAATAAEIQAQIQLMLAEVQFLQKQLAAQSATGQQAPNVTTGTSVSTGGACPFVGRVLKRGSSGDDVSRLQRYLAADPSVYPEAQVTGYFGALTEAAVMRWQTKFNIVSSGNAESTGFGVVGPRTAAAISLQCGGNSSGVNPQNPVSTGPTVGGFIQVTPVTGIAPLAVQVIANVNTVASCEGAVYTLDWGDGTIASTIPVAAGTCSQTQQVFSHIYVTPSTYTIRLSAGQHSTTAMVQVGAAQ